jgi:hypothetical protein
MDVRPQVFVSSTYLDLIEERQAVTRILLELSCFPAGMELFPAGDEDKMDLIKGVIDDSDYYVLILGGKYGSVDAETDVSYTEMEYDYAIETQTPVMAFLRRDLGCVVSQKVELESGKAEKLDEFRKKAECLFPGFRLSRRLATVVHGCGPCLGAPPPTAPRC